MKRIAFSIMLACALELSLEAQAHSQGGPPNTNALAASVAPTIAARSLNSRTWVRIISQTNAAGQVSTVTNKAYTEMASGLCYENEDHVLVDSVEQIDIDIVAGGASATQGQAKVHFAANANTPGGAVIMKSRDGKTFATRVYGLSYWDVISGTNILLAPLQDCQGIVVSNRVIYTNAFQGLNADLEYIYTKFGLEQNVILRESLPTPESVGTGLASASTKLQVLTEFIASPVPNTIKTQVVNNISEDTLINWGTMMIGMGKAFFVPGQNGNKAIDLGRVSKHWKQLEGGRTFLFEEVPYPAISNAVQNLPLHASAGAARATVKHLAALEPLLPRDFASKATPMKMQLAKSMPDRPGVLLDYMEFNGYADSPVFQSDTTYYISGFLAAWNPVFEGGAVVKFGWWGYSNRWYNIMNYGDNLCQFNGSSYRPVIFTCMDDNSVGDPIDGSSGSPSSTQDGSPYIWEDCGERDGVANVAIGHVRFSYAGSAYEDDNDLSFIFTDCQFFQCGANAVSVGIAAVYMGNDLFSGCGAVLGGNNVALDAENITADSIQHFYRGGTASGGITNSILTACHSSITNFILDHTLVAVAGSNIYQTVGDGHYYLANSSTNRNAGTTSIRPSLLAELKTKTTYPPVVYASTNIDEPPDNYGIAAPRDSGNPGPDKGYHYDPLDHVFGGVIMGSSTTFANGVVAGWFNDGSGYGIYLGGYWQIATFQGTAGAPGWWVRANTVQESGGITVWPGAGAAGGLMGAGCPSPYGYSPAQVNLVFTHCSILAGGDGGPLNHFAQYTNGSLVVNATNSEFYSGSLFGFGLSGNFMNCLMDRVNAGQYDGDAWTMTNCTWYGGSLTLTNDMYVVRDSAFDGTIINAPSNEIYTNLIDFNAFGDGAIPFPSVGASNVYLPSQGTNMQDFNWQSNLLGNCYLPSDSPLIAVGDFTADQLGLSSFTAQTNQVAEGTAIVDIGYHYMACPQSSCISEAGGQLSLNTQDVGFAIGEPVAISATWTNVPGITGVGGFDTNGNWVMTPIPTYSAILTNWNVLDWEGSKVTNGGSGIYSSYSFTPTNPGEAEITFYYTYSNSAPCGGIYTNSISKFPHVIAVGSLAPANTGNWIEISNTPPGTSTFLVKANPTNGQNTLQVDATPNPGVGWGILPDGWSLNGARAESTNLDISAPAVYKVDCVCGTSALTNIIIVTTNTVATNIGYTTIGLVAYWSMDDGPGATNAKDSSGNGVDVPLQGSPSWGSNYLTLNGSNQYGVAGSNALTNLDNHDMTICAWINTRSTNLQGIVAKDYWLPTGYGGWCFAIEANQLNWNLETGAIHDIGPGIVPLGQWMFVSVTWSYTNSSNFQACFYINGQQNSYYDSAGTSGIIEQRSDSYPLFVGNLQNAQNTNNYPFDGSMREVGIYNRALSAAEILTNFLNTEPGTNVAKPDLLYYKMTEFGQFTNYPLHLSNSASYGAAATGYLWDTNEGAPAWTSGPGGISNIAIHFHGVVTNSTYITTANSNLFNFTTNLFTINLWVEPTSSSGHYLMQNLDNAATNGWFLYYDANYSAWFGTASNGDAYTCVTPGEGAVHNTNWNMVTVVRTSLTNAIIYIDGLPAVFGYIMSPGSSTNPLNLGIDSTFTNDYDGNLWLAQIWSTNLPPSDIANLYYNQRNGSAWP